MAACSAQRIAIHGANGALPMGKNGGRESWMGWFEGLNGRVWSGLTW